jgi:hypothetical protein
VISVASVAKIKPSPVYDWRASQALASFIATFLATYDSTNQLC